MATRGAAQAQEFHQTFQQLKQDVIASLELAFPIMSEVTSKLSSLKSALAEVLPTLPKYDQGKYTSVRLLPLPLLPFTLTLVEKRKRGSRGVVLKDEDIAELEKRVAAVRARANPKAKFSFKRSAPSSTSTSGISTPIPTQEAAGPTQATAVQELTSQAGPSHPPPAPSAHHTISNLSNTLIRPPPNALQGENGGYALSLESLSDCLIDLRPPSTSPASAFSALTALHVKGLSRCVLIKPPGMTGSCLLHDVEDSVLILGAQQFRMHTSHRTVILLNVSSYPIIEHCSSLRFGPYPPIDNFASGRNMSKHHGVQDFDHPGGMSPNWRPTDHLQRLALSDLLAIDSNRPLVVKSIVDRTLLNFGVEGQL